MIYSLFKESHQHNEKVYSFLSDYYEKISGGRTEKLISKKLDQLKNLELDIWSNASHKTVIGYLWDYYLPKVSELNLTNLEKAVYANRCFALEIREKVTSTIIKVCDPLVPDNFQNFKDPSDTFLKEVIFRQIALTAGIVGPKLDLLEYNWDSGMTLTDYFRQCLSRIRLNRNAGRASVNQLQVELTVKKMVKKLGENPRFVPFAKKMKHHAVLVKLVAGVGEDFDVEDVESAVENCFWEADFEHPWSKSEDYSTVKHGSPDLTVGETIKINAPECDSKHFSTFNFSVGSQQLNFQQTFGLTRKPSTFNFPQDSKPSAFNFLTKPLKIQPLESQEAPEVYFNEGELINRPSAPDNFKQFQPLIGKFIQMEIPKTCSEPARDASLPAVCGNSTADDYGYCSGSDSDFVDPKLDTELTLPSSTPELRKIPAIPPINLNYKKGPEGNQTIQPLSSQNHSVSKTIKAPMCDDTVISASMVESFQVRKIFDHLDTRQRYYLALMLDCNNAGKLNPDMNLEDLREVIRTHNFSQGVIQETDIELALYASEDIEIKANTYGNIPVTMPTSSNHRSWSVFKSLVRGIATSPRIIYGSDNDDPRNAILVINETDKDVKIKKSQKVAKMKMVKEVKLPENDYGLTTEKIRLTNDDVFQITTIFEKMISKPFFTAIPRENTKVTIMAPTYEEVPPSETVNLDQNIAANLNHSTINSDSTGQATSKRTIKQTLKFEGTISELKTFMEEQEKEYQTKILDTIPEQLKWVFKKRKGRFLGELPGELS